MTDKIHHWSGWPGAYCLHCGTEDPYEIGLADNTYDVIKKEWSNEELEEQCKRDSICSIGFSDKCGQCMAHLKPIFGFYEEEYPIYSGGPGESDFVPMELHELVTVKELNELVNSIKDLNELFKECRKINFYALAVLCDPNTGPEFNVLKCDLRSIGKMIGELSIKYFAHVCRGKADVKEI